MNTGVIQTVLGPIAPEELGVTLCHEHLSMSHEVAFTPANKDETWRHTMPFTLQNSGWIRQYPYSHESNLKLNEVPDDVLHDVKLYKAAGGASLVENSTCGLHRKLADVRRISQESGVHVILGTGYYVGASLPPAYDSWPQERLVEEMTRDLINGLEDSNVRCGVIGEVGCSWPLSAREVKSLRAAAVTQATVGGCPVIIHPGRHPDSPAEILRVFQEAGGDVSRTVISHLDRTFMTKAQVLEFAGSGCYCEYDLFGVETSYYQLANLDMPSDSQRIECIKWLLEDGFLDQVLMAHDIHTKHRLTRYGGHGYAHILETVVPMMIERGLTKETLDHILVNNPRRWLTGV